jgi:hypothetical protein
LSRTVDVSSTIEAFLSQTDRKIENWIFGIKEKDYKNKYIHNLIRRGNRSFITAIADLTNQYIFEGKGKLVINL